MEDEQYNVVSDIMVGIDQTQIQSGSVLSGAECQLATLLTSSSEIVGRSQAVDSESLTFQKL